MLAFCVGGGAWCAWHLLCDLQLLSESVKGPQPQGALGPAVSWTLRLTLQAVFVAGLWFLPALFLWGVLEKYITRPLRQHRDQRNRAGTKKAIEDLARSADHFLSEAELAKARSLLGQGTADGVRLAAVVLRSVKPSRADLAAVFSPDVLTSLVESVPPTFWPLTVEIFKEAEPCVKWFAECVGDHLRARRESRWLDAGFMGHVWPNAAWQEPYKVLLECEFPPGFITSLAGAISDGVAEERLNMNMIASYYVYSFPFEILTTLSAPAARILAGLPVLKKESTLPCPPFWEPYGQHLALRGINNLTDEVADALSHAKRNILFGNLEVFPATPGFVNLACRLARQQSIVLGETTQVAPEISAVLPPAAISSPAQLRDILYCNVVTEQDRNRIVFVSMGGGVPNILR